MSASITELNRLLSLPQNASDIYGFKLDLGDGRQLIVEQWSPTVTNDDEVIKIHLEVVKIHLEGVIVFKGGGGD